MRPDKAGGVEMYCAKNYLDYRGHWGVGGVLLHEYCHAYHFKHCKDGFNNEQIKEVTHSLSPKNPPRLTDRLTDRQISYYDFNLQTPVVNQMHTLITLTSTKHIIGL